MKVVLMNCLYSEKYLWSLQPLSLHASCSARQFSTWFASAGDLFIVQIFFLSWRKMGEILHDPCKVQTPGIAAEGIEIGWKFHNTKQQHNKCEEKNYHDFSLHKILSYCKKFGWEVDQFISLFCCVRSTLFHISLSAVRPILQAWVTGGFSEMNLCRAVYSWFRCCFWQRS